MRRGRGGWSADPPGAESATLTSARKRSLELASQLPGDFILSFFFLFKSKILLLIQDIFLQNVTLLSTYLVWIFITVSLLNVTCLENHKVPVVDACVRQIKRLEYEATSWYLGFWSLDDAESELDDIYGATACVIGGVIQVNPTEVWNGACLRSLPGYFHRLQSWQRLAEQTAL